MKRIKISKIDNSSVLEVTVTNWFYNLLINEFQFYGGIKRFEIELIDTFKKRLYFNTKDTVKVYRLINEVCV